MGKALSPSPGPSALGLHLLIVPGHLASPGILYVNRSLDFETSPKYFLSIECSRKGSSALSDTITVVINVTDVNEHRPRFPQGLYGVKVLENAMVGDVVLTVRTLHIAFGGRVWGVGSSPRLASSDALQAWL